MGQEKASYGECLKAHAHMGGKVDGCQEYKAGASYKDGAEYCSICNCHMNYHKKVVPQARVTHVTEVVYTECHKNHFRNGSYAKDGCREYVERIYQPLICDACNCERSFHRNEVTKEVITYI